MKEWLRIFTALLAAGVVVGGALFGWSRAVARWETAAQAHVEAIRGRVVKAAATAEHEGEARVLLLKAQGEMLRHEVTVAEAHLQAWAPLRDETGLREAVMDGKRSGQQISELVVALEKAAAESAVAMAKAEAARVEAEKARYARTLDGWNEISGQQVSVLNDIAAALPFLHGQALLDKKRELDGAVVAAGQHLAIAPGWSDPEPLRAAVEQATKAAKAAN